VSDEGGVPFESNPPPDEMPDLDLDVAELPLTAPTRNQRRGRPKTMSDPMMSDPEVPGTAPEPDPMPGPEPTPFDPGEPSPGSPTVEPSAPTEAPPLGGPETPDGDPV